MPLAISFMQQACTFLFNNIQPTQMNTQEGMPQISKHFQEQPRRIPLNQKPQTFTNRQIYVQLSQKLTQLEERVSALEVAEKQVESKSKIKKIRRRSNDIQRSHACKFCRKAYGTLTALNLHLKVKHRQQAKNISST